MIEEQVLSYILGNKNWDFVVSNDIDESFFSKSNSEKFIYLKKYYNTYNTVPDINTFTDIYNDFEYDEVTEPESYLVNEIRFNKINIDAVRAYSDIRDQLSNPKYKDRDRQETIDKIASITKTLNELVTASQSMKYSDLNDLGKLALDTFEERENSKDKLYYKTGLRWLDEMFNGGWDKDNDYVIVAGRPGTGKSMLLCKLAASQLMNKKKVAFYEGEMSKVQTYERIVAAISGISATDMLLAKNSIKNKYVNTITNRMPSFGGTLNIITPADLGSRYPTAFQLETFVKKTNADILFVDQLSLMEDLDHAKVPFEKAGNISRQIKSLRDKLNIPIICASQLNRTQNENNKLDNNQIAQSDMIAQDATRIIMLSSNREEEDQILTFTVTKNRTGKSYGTCDYNVDFAKCNFTEIPKEGSSEAANLESLEATAPEEDEIF